MTTSAARSVTLGPVEQRLLQALDRRRARVWNTDEDLPTGLTADSVRLALQRLVAGGQLERIERGTYAVMPRSGRVLVRPIELVGEWFRDEPYALAGHAAAEQHRLTLDTSTTIEVLLARPKRPVEFQGAHYVFSRRDARSVEKDNVRVEHDDGWTAVASPAKLLVLLLGGAPGRRGTRPVRDMRLALDVLERGAARHLWDKVDWPLIVKRHGGASAARRLGYLLDRLGISSAADFVPLRGVSGNVPLSPLYPATGPIDPRWRIIVNDPILRG